MKFSALKKFLEKPRDDAGIARAFARCFSSADGEIVLEHLHRQTLFRVIDPMMPPDHMRFLEGQRQLVLWLCQMAAKGKTETLKK